jgi:hypothetical protein
MHNEAEAAAVIGDTTTWILAQVGT